MGYQAKILEAWAARLRGACQIAGTEASRLTEALTEVALVARELTDAADGVRSMIAISENRENGGAP